jgi:dihydrofolate synthase / folylpolyglutamate synthase
MTYTESLQYLLSLGHETLSMKFGLEGIKALLHELCHPQEGLRSVHIAGTNGKGSTSAMVAEMAHDSGLKTGLYTSPHLVDITERMQINRSPISRDRFAQEKAELVVLEVGLGGRLDATNICRPIVSAITTIGEDHQQYLGTSLAAIAFEKAGIIKPRVPVVSAPQASEAMRVIQARCEELNSPLVVADEIPDLEPVVSPVQGEGFFRMRVETKKDAYDVHLGLRGRHQAVNALVAIHLGEILGFDRSAIEYGLSASTWPGRLELIRRRSLAPLLIDGAHNADGARALADFLREFHSSQDRLEEITLIFGVMSDKALHHMVEVLFPLATTRIVTRIDNPRSVEPEEIAKVAKRAGWDSIVVESTAEALAKADQITSPNGMICVCGSLYLVGEIKSLL